MKSLTDTTYKCDEAADILKLKIKHIKRLIKVGKLEAIDIRINPDPNRFDVRFVRIVGDSLREYCQSNYTSKLFNNNN